MSSDVRETGEAADDGQASGASPAEASPSRPLLELGPLLLFFGANWIWGIYAATGAFMVAVAIAMAISWKLDRRVPPMTIFTAVAVLVFGGLTLYLKDELFIKIKVTILNALFGSILVIGLLTGKILLRVVLGHAFQLTDRGWRLLTIRYAVFFFFLAALNEVVWRNVSTDVWVSFKVFGLMGLTLVFTLLQVPLLQRHEAIES